LNRTTTQFGGFIAHRCNILAIVVAAILVAGMGAPRAHADFEIATFSNVIPGEVVTIPVNGQSVSGWAGDYDFVNGSGIINGPFHGFCIDIAQDIYYNQTVQFGVAQLQNAPVPGSGMGVARANLIRELWYNDYAQSGLSNSNAAAFQIAIWEIINESSANPLNVRSGTFWATGNAATLNTANSWLQALDLTGNGPKVNDLMALTSYSYQDYVVEVTAPAPSGWLLALVGTACVMLPAAGRYAKLRAVAPSHLARG
jgi:hypothetical protein